MRYDIYVISQVFVHARAHLYVRMTLACKVSMHACMCAHVHAITGMLYFRPSQWGFMYLCITFDIRQVSPANDGARRRVLFFLICTGPR